MAEGLMEYKAHGPDKAPKMFVLGCRKVTLKKREKPERRK